MNTLHTDRAAVMVFADEIAEGDTVAIICTHRGPQIREDDGTLTGFAACRALTTPHQARQHYLNIERLREGPGLLRCITRNEEGEQVSWSAHRDDAVSIIRSGD